MAHPRIFQHLLPTIIQTFRIHCPNVRLRISENQSDEILKQVLSAAAALGLVALPEKNWRTSANPYIAYTKELDFEHLLIDDMVVCMSADCPLKNAHTLTSRTLAAYPVVAYNTGVFGETLNESGIVFTSNSIETHKKLIEQNLAVDVMSRFEYNKIYGADTHFLAVPYTEDRLTITLVTKQNTTLSPEAHYFAQLIRQFNYT